LRIGVKSTAVTWVNKNPKEIMEKFVYFIAVCHISLAFIAHSYIYTVPIMLLGDFNLIKEIRKLDLTNREECSQFFKKNNKFGAFIFGSLFLASFLR
jgi:4-hydroxybenzoate polyprenyltransferase